MQDSFGPHHHPTSDQFYQLTYSRDHLCSPVKGAVFNIIANSQKNSLIAINLLRIKHTHASTADL